MITEQVIDGVKYVTKTRVIRWSETILFEGTDDPKRPHLFRERLVANSMEFRLYSDTKDAFLHFPAVNPRQNAHWLRLTEDGVLELIVLAASAAVENEYGVDYWLGKWWHKGKERHSAHRIVSFLEEVIETVKRGPLYDREEVRGYEEC